MKMCPKYSPASGIKVVVKQSLWLVPYLQLVCIFSILGVQEWQNIDKILIETQKNSPEILPVLEIREKIHSFSARGAAKFGQRRSKINSLNEGMSGILKKFYV